MVRKFEDHKQLINTYAANNGSPSELFTKIIGGTLKTCACPKIAALGISGKKHYCISGKHSKRLEHNKKHTLNSASKKILKKELSGNGFVSSALTLGMQKAGDAAWNFDMKGMKPWPGSGVKGGDIGDAMSAYASTKAQKQRLPDGYYNASNANTGKKIVNYGISGIAAMLPLLL